ncbi:hypothetical protein GCM10010435_87950 [Winogradskya consettensis]|uniref:Uncharacterized protein n=1 Tax=Winogradskya consettensis TaxID=113560 RepID=A0A919T114_9ACTN|nr:hypothetical protein [Actinoplanes consettensis]GIM80987.1 hypothetical protein Aco04nite_74230 [Actinoplanes consettensis]
MKNVQGFVNFTALAVGLAAGVAQLAGFSNGLGRLILTMVGIACLLFLVVRFTLFYYVRRGGQLKRELEEANQRMATLQVGHQHYVDAIDRIIDQEGPIYTEALELAVTIGADATGDTIVERRRTTPRPRVTQRAIRPVVPSETERITSLEDLEFSCGLDGDAAGNISVLPLPRNHRPRAWLVFDPGLTEQFEWMIRYRPAGLWDPLRAHGFDYLIWNDRLPAGNGDRSILSELTVKFYFPDGPRSPSVVERRGFGSALPPQRLDDAKGWQITWHDPAPAGRRYEWDLTQSVRPPT